MDLRRCNFFIMKSLHDKPRIKEKEDITNHERQVKIHFTLYHPKSYKRYIIILIIMK